MRVFKFGGASLKDASAIKTMLHIMKLQKTTSQLLVVVSAMGKTTNALEALLNNFWEKKDYKCNIENLREFFIEITQNLFDDPEHHIFFRLDSFIEKLKNQLLTSPREDNLYDLVYDQIVSYGEVISSTIIVEFLNNQGIECEWLDARKIITTNSEWREGQVDWEKTEAKITQDVKKRLSEKILITQGFIGGNEQGIVTTLGREGSDFSGAIFAHCLRADSLTIWKDVPGVLNADPKKIANAQLYKELSYQEAAEMTKYGARVIHPKTIAPLAQRKIPLFVKSFLNPKEAGTRIGEQSSYQIQPIIIFKEKQTLIRLDAAPWKFLKEMDVKDIVEKIAQFYLRVNLMHKSPASLYISVDDQPHRVEQFLKNISSQFEISQQKPLVLIRMKHASESTISKIMEDKRIVIEEKNSEWYQALAYV